ncbi:MAG TPA: hypothetical protein VMC43_02470, partial [Candidatus Paceibacterota bacterium]|nr:hypothetical protein [Candidatus Paceibacterota bacterium]
MIDRLESFFSGASIQSAIYVDRKHIEQKNSENDGQAEPGVEKKLGNGEQANLGKQPIPYLP